MTYPNKALDYVCQLLLDECGLTLEEIKALALDIPGECEAIEQDRNERAWEERSEPDDSSYRTDMINAGRGHLLR